jgi:hypothetical protein
MKIIILVTFTAIFSLSIFGQSTPTFAKYSAKIGKVSAKEVNLKSHKNARNFRTNLRNAFKEGVNFAGGYVLTSWGCGTSCLQTAIIDGKTGNVFFPKMLQGTSFGFGELSDKEESIEFKKNSRLLVINGYTANGQNQSKYGIWYYEWTGKDLKLVKFVPKKVNVE